MANKTVAEQLFDAFREPGEKYWYELSDALKTRWENVARKHQELIAQSKAQDKLWEGYDGR
jgi:hypothetical protein